MDPLQPIQISPCSKRLWYVIFTPGEGNLPWWQKLAIRKHPPVFQHVVLLSPLTDTHVQIVEPTSAHIAIEVREYEQSWTKEILRIAEHVPVLEYVAEPETSRHITNAVPSCISVAKAVLGLDACCVTPYGLYRALERNGAVLVRPYE